MRKIVFIAFFVLNYIFSFAIDKQATNKLDSLGLKQGKWIEFEAHPVSEGFTIHDNENGSSTFEDKYNEQRLNIYYFFFQAEDGIRDGTWDIYSASNRLVFTVNYNRGLIEGQFIIYYKNGESLVCNIRHELKTKVEIYLKSGVLKEINYFSTRELLGYIFY